MLNVMTDFGAVGDGVADDTAAFQAMFTAAGAAAPVSRGGNSCYAPMPPVRYRITSQVTYIPASGQNSFLRLHGDAGGTEIVCSGPPSHYAFSIRNTVPFIMEDLVLLSPTPTGGGTDMRGIVGNRSKTIVQRCKFFGHSLNGAAIVSDDVYVDQCEFGGLRATFGAIAAVQFARCIVRNTRIIDYGFWKGTNYSKSDGNNLRWIFLQDPLDTTDTQNGNDEGLVLLDNVHFDENAHAWVEFKPEGPGPDGASTYPTHRYQKVVIKRSGGNCGQSPPTYPNFRGFKIKQSESVDIAGCRFGWADQDRVGIELVDAGDVRLRALHAVAGVPNPNLRVEVTADASTRLVVDEESNYWRLRSSAARTYVVRAGSVAELRVASAAIPANVFAVETGSAGKVARAAVDTEATEACGVVLDAAAADGDFVRVCGKSGEVCTVLSDGTTAIAPGDLLGLSTAPATPGYVAARTTGGTVARARTGAPATLGAAVVVDLARADLPAEHVVVPTHVAGGLHLT